jgi:peptidyl-prolyl cis-trans isomerase A (cyclophilin A)
MFRLLFVLGPLVLTNISVEAQTKRSAVVSQALPKKATLVTTLGNIEVELFPERAPLTVRNFVELAKGEKAWKGPGDPGPTKKPLYKQTIFHRVIPDFMIQGGDPFGTGSGQPIPTFGDEFSDKDDLDGFPVAGLLAMANRGPSTNGSQFFITVVPTPWLKSAIPFLERQPLRV